MYMPSRPFLECHVRRRLQAIGNVTIQGGQDVAELTSTTDRNRVTGVRVIDRDGGAEQELTADLVVDAMGRAAHTPAFLESLGYGRPVEDHIVMHTTYVSQLLRIPPGTLKEMLCLISAAPGRPTGMFLFGYENDIVDIHGLRDGRARAAPRFGRNAVVRPGVRAGAPAGGSAGRRANRAGGTTPHAVQPVAPLRQDAAIPRRPAGQR